MSPSTGPAPKGIDGCGERCHDTTLQLLSILFVDPSDHTRLRRLVNKSFTPRMVESMRPRIQQRVDDLLDAAQNAGRMDVIHDLASPLPMIVIAEMLGVPVEDRDPLKRWSDD